MTLATLDTLIVLDPQATLERLLAVLVGIKHITQVELVTLLND